MRPFGCLCRCAPETSNIRRRGSWQPVAFAAMWSALVLLTFGRAAWAVYPVKDSHARVSDSTNIFWLDNRRILFQALGDRTLASTDGSQFVVNRLYIWDIDSGAIVGQGEIGGGLCYAGGYVRYWRWKEDEAGRTAEWLAGPLGYETKITGAEERRPIDRTTCRPQDNTPLPEWTNGQFVWRLKPEHGFLVLGGQKDDLNTRVTYHPNGMRDGIAMPFKRREFFFPGIKFVSSQSAYFIVGEYFVADLAHPIGGYNKSPWPTGKRIPIWWLYPNGRVEEMFLPTEARNAAPSQIFAGKPGIFYVSPRYPKYDGLFKVLDSKRVERVMKGFIATFAISPDGCQIALNHDSHYTGKRGQGTLKVINVCQ